MSNIYNIKTIIVRTLDNKSKVYNDIQFNKLKTFRDLKQLIVLDTNYKSLNTQNIKNTKNTQNIKNTQNTKNTKNTKNIKILFNNIILNNNNFIDKFVNKIQYQNEIVLELLYNVKGGFIMDVINAVINIFKLLVGVPKLILFVLRFLLWLIKFMIYIIALLLNIIDKDGILALIKFITAEILLAPIKFIMIYVRKFVNNIGNLTFIAIAGSDNVKYDDEEPTEFHNDKCHQEKCYRTSDGTIPFSVIIMTILCPPLGVLMEYGITGWFNILICTILTFAFYFPGLIYALILLYC